MISGDALFAGSLGLLLVCLALASMHAKNLYASVVMFISFGIVAALVWAYLGAPDLALAEAAISAGLTGVLLFAALARIGVDSPSTRVWRGRATLLPGAILVLLVLAVFPLADQRSPLPAMAAMQLSQTGVANPVTGALLNFRAWDTLLELLVLLLALLGSRDLRPTPEERPSPWLLFSAWSRMLVPLLTLFGGYLLWRGSDWPGGAFQAGALLAAGAVVLRLNGLLPALAWQQPLVRCLSLAGLLVFTGVAALTAWWGEGWLNYPSGFDKGVMVLVEVVATVSIATILALLVVGNKEELHS